MNSPLRPRAPRSKPADQVPRDDSPRDGTEIWREVGGANFLHWDRWLLRLAVDEPLGLNTLAREFRRRARDQTHQGTDGIAEAKLAQIADLQARLERLQYAPADLLDLRERQSKWLRDKAVRRVWHARSIHFTRAMPRAW